MLTPILDKLNSSPLYSEEHGLFRFPGNNQLIYMAYLDKVLRSNGEKLPFEALVTFFLKSEVPGKPGLFTRAPYANPPNSHDEIMGLFSLMNSALLDKTSTNYEKIEAHLVMARVLRHLDSHLGYFNSNKMPGFFRFFRYNVYRMYWLRSYLKACRGSKLNLLEQALWCLKLILDKKSDSDSGKTGPGPRLRSWLMAHVMVQYPMCKRVWESYKAALLAKGLSLSNDLRQEPREKVLEQAAKPGYELI